MKISNIITVNRFFLGFMMIVSAFHSMEMFIIFYAAAVLTDVLDGYAARKLNQASKTGAKLDIAADNFIVVCLFLGLLVLKPSALFAWRWHILLLLAYYASAQTISLLTSKTLIWQRTYAANIASIIFPFAVISVLFLESNLLIYFYIFMMYYSLSEKMLMKVFGINGSSIIKTRRVKAKLLFLALLCLALIILLVIPVSRQDRVCFKEKCIAVEVRDTYEGRALGLMYREHLSEDEGMLFVFEAPGKYTFWMKNMKIPIDIIFIDEKGKIVGITRDAKPCLEEPCGLYSHEGEALYVVEVRANFTLRHNVEMGQKVSLP